MTRTTFAAIGAALTITTAANAASPTIAEIAPPNTIAVVSVDSFTAMHEAFDASFLGALWRDPEMQDWISRMLEEGGIAEEFTADNGPGEFFKKVLDRADMEREDIATPSGAVGAAMWWGESADTGVTGPLWTVVLDFGEDNDESENMHAFVESMIEVIDEDDDEIVVTNTDYDGTDIWLLAPPEDESDDADDSDEWDDWEDYEPEPWIERAYVGWVDGALVIAGDRSALERTVDRIHGVDLDTLADTAQLADARKAHAGSQIFAAGFVAPMLDAFVPAEDMLGFDVNPMLDTLGLLDLYALSGSVRFDGLSGGVEQTYSVVAPNKKGLVALFDRQLDGFNPPSFVNADTNTIYMFAFDWAGVMPLVNQAINAIPIESERQQMQMMAGMFAGGIEPMLNAMRQDVLVINTINRPFTAESSRAFAAFGVRDGEAVTNSINAMGGLVGLESRDFLGNVIWDMEPYAAVGLGFGRLFTGMAEQVEDAMRQANNDNAASLADDPDFRQAISMLKGDGMLYTYQNNREKYEYAIWNIENLESTLRAQLAEYDLDEDTIDEIVSDQIESNPLFTIGFPSPELIFRHLGDAAVLEMHSTDDGFTGRAIIHAADDRD